MNIFSIFQQLFQDEKEKERKVKVLEFIENNSSKSEFVHWLLNNVGDLAFSEKDSWEKIKREVSENSEVSYSSLRHYSLTLKDEEIAEGALEKVAEEAEEAEETARKLTFLGRFKKFSIAIGGIILFLGLTKIIASATIFLGKAKLISFLEPYIVQGIAAFLGITGVLELLGGIFLIAM